MGEGGMKMVSSLPLLSCELSVSVKENSERAVTCKDEMFISFYSIWVFNVFSLFHWANIESSSTLPNLVIFTNSAVLYIKEIDFCVCKFGQIMIHADKEILIILRALIVAVVIYILFSFHTLILKKRKLIAKLLKPVIK